MKKCIIPKTIFCLCLVSLMACKKPPIEPEPDPEEVLPEATHEGLQTFGCLVNGKVWVAKTPYSIGGPVPLDGTYNEETQGFWIEGVREIKSDNIFEAIRFYGANISEIGTYEMFVSDDNERALKDYKDSYSCETYLHDIEHKGILNITYLDIENNIISGTFSMDVLSHASCFPETLEITEGRFDMKY